MRNLYLVAYYYQRPSNQRVRTNRPGWMTAEQNISWDEQVHIATRLRDRDLSMSRVILDLSRRSVVKNSWNSHKTFEELFEYYRAEYPQYAEQIASKLYPDIAAGASQ